MAHYKDSSNYLTCTFGDGVAKIEQIKDGEKITLASRTAQEISTNAKTFSVRVINGWMNCVADHVFTIASNIDTETGGVGVRIWNEELGVASLNISSVSVLDQ